MKNIFFIFLFLFNSSIIFAQKINITGTVIEANTNQKLEYATIILKPVDASTIIKGGITNFKGNFDVEIKKGTYNVSIEFISYETKDLGKLTFTKNTNLGTIILNLSDEYLEEVEIIAEKSTVEIRLDKKIYNVGKDMTVKGGTASDVLDNVPSVTVDVEGVISLRGNENVRVLINGKPSTYSSDDALKQLPADAIKKIEVITSPSARYEAEGSAGIINIILRKGKAQGLNGVLNLNINHPEGYGTSTNLNYKTKKFNFFNNLGYNYNKTPGNAFFENEYFQTTQNPFETEYRTYDRLRKNLNINFGVAYTITDKSSITGNFAFRNSDRNTDTNLKIQQYDVDFMEQDFFLRNEIEDEIDKQLEFNVNFTQNFKTDGHKLTFDFRQSKSNDDELADIFSFSDLTEKTSNLETNKRFLFQGDYVLPIGENAQFEAGFKSLINNIETDYTLSNNDNGVFIENLLVSNIFNYKEDISAIYMQYGNKFGQFSGLFGIRTELSKIDIASQEETNNKNYTEWFPTLNLSYEFKKGEDITLGYNRRIRRPRSRFLNPFSSRASESNIFQGNPDLDPAYTNGLDLGYLKKFKKITFSTSIYYNYTTDVFQFVREPTGEVTSNGTPITRATPKNIASEERYGWEFSLNYNAFKWWKLNSNFNFFNTFRDGNNIVENYKNTSWTSRFSSRIKLPAKIDWQTTVNYRGPRENFQSKIKGITSVNLAFSKDILKDKATLSLNVSDLFNSRKRKSDTFIEDFSNSYSEFQWRERQVRLNFTYRLNQKKKRDRQRNGSFNDNEGGGF